MADDLPPGTPELDDPLLVADLIRLLSIKGAIGRMRLADFVIPVVSLGDVVQPTVAVRTPSFRSTDVFSAGMVINPAAGTVLADTGPLPAGIYDVIIYTAADTGNLQLAHDVEHRDAANAANLAVWIHIMTRGPNVTIAVAPYVLAYEIGANERLRIISSGVSAAGAQHVGVIFARIR